MKEVTTSKKSATEIQIGVEAYEKRLIDLMLKKDKLERDLCGVDADIAFTVNKLRDLKS